MSRTNLTATAARGRISRLRLLATAAGLALPMALSAQAEAAKIAGQFGGSAQSIGVSGVSPNLSASLHNAASEACPCQGTNGQVNQKSSAAITAPGVLFAQTTIATAYGGKTRTTAKTSQSATITGLNLLGGIITADALQAVTNVNATASQLTEDDNGTTLTNLVVNGTPVDPNVPDNTTLQLPGFGSVTVKQVTQGHNKQEAYESVDMLVVDISKTNSLGLPIGAKIIIAHAKASYDRQQPLVALSGGASGVRANAQAGAMLNEAAGSAASIGIPNCAGTNGKTLQRSVSNVSAGTLLSIGTIKNTAFGGAQGKTSVVQTTSTTSNVSLLGGLLTATSIAAAAQETSTGGVDTPSTAGSGFAGLAIGGVPVDPNIPPNTTLALPGIGDVVVNEQKLGAKSAVQVNGLHVTVTTPNLLGLPVGAQFILAHANAVARRF